MRGRRARAPGRTWPDFWRSRGRGPPRRPTWPSAGGRSRRRGPRRIARAIAASGQETAAVSGWDRRLRRRWRRSGAGVGAMGTGVAARGGGGERGEGV